MTSPIEIVGLTLASGDALLKSYSALEQHFESARELPLLVEKSKERLDRMCKSIELYSEGVDIDAIPGLVLKRAGEEFREIKHELDTLNEKHERNNLGWKLFQLNRHTRKVRENNAKLIQLEHNLDVCGLISQETISLRKQMDKMMKILSSRGDPVISSVIGRVNTEDRADAYVIPDLAKSILDALSKSGLAEDTKRELADLARSVWEGWKVDPNDIEFVRRPNGDRHHIGSGGASQVYLARIESRNESGRIIPEHKMEVAVKTFGVSSSQAKERFPLFMREVFLQKDAHHPCIVRTFGGYWPDVKDIQVKTRFEPYIVMERMTHTLKDALENKLLEDFATKRRILVDVAAGIAHLHSRRIVHCDIKLENVLVRVVNKQITGRAKVTDFGLSRKAKTADMISMTKATGLAGTFSYLPPEYFTNTPPKASKPNRDIWSFGVLMCEVLAPGFLSNLSSGRLEGLHLATRGEEYPRAVAESAKNISGEQVLKDLVNSCLSLDPNLRPDIEDVSAQLAKPTYEFHFDNYLSQEFKEKKVLRYLRHYFPVESQAQTCTVGYAVTTFQTAVDNGNLSARNILAYCKYFGIGVTKDKRAAAELYQLGSATGDVTAKYSLGVVLFLAKRYETALPLLKEAANLGSAEGLMWLAICYQYGYGVEQDEKKAFELIFSAAKGGSQDAHTHLASYFMFGIGTEKDKTKAMGIARGLSANGHAFASLWLSIWFDQGISVRKDPEKAEHYLKLAQKRGIAATWAFNRDRNQWVLSDQ